MRRESCPRALVQVKQTKSRPIPLVKTIIIGKQDQETGKEKEGQDESVIHLLKCTMQIGAKGVQEQEIGFCQYCPHTHTQRRAGKTLLLIT